MKNANSSPPLTLLPNVVDLRYNDLRQAITALGEPPFRAKQIHEWLFSHHANSFSEMSSLSLRLRQQLAESFSLKRAVVLTKQESSDGEGVAPTRKLLLQLHDGALIESVLIPAEHRMTACLSSQAGCALQCTFCATGTMGLQRNLSAGEIWEQLYALNALAEEEGKSITNVVFMGMGEPLLNSENVLEAIETISSRNYQLTLSQRKITISTVGIPPEIERLSHSGLKTKLAISLHSARQEVRQQLMPIAAKRYPLQQLSNTLAAYCKTTGEAVTIVYMLLNEVNDSIEDARLLARYCRNFSCKINLIDYNPIVTIPFGKVKESPKNEFQAYLEAQKFHVTVRKSYGASVNAACGQLVTHQQQLQTP